MLFDVEGRKCRDPRERRRTSLSWLRLGSIKGEVKKKHDAIGWISFCFAARVFEQELF
jgi:hypothetical protein